MEDVSRRSGVAKSTIYRRWSSKSELLADAVLDAMQHDLPTPDSGSVDRDLVRLLTDDARFVRTPIGHLVLQLAAASLTDQALAVAIESIRAPRQRSYKTVLVRGVAAGQLAPDLDVRRAVDILASVVWMRALTHQPLDRRVLTGVVSLARRGMARAPVDEPGS